MKIRTDNGHRWIYLRFGGFNQIEESTNDKSVDNYAKFYLTRGISLSREICDRIRFIYWLPVAPSAAKISSTANWHSLWTFEAFAATERNVQTKNSSAQLVSSESGKNSMTTAKCTIRRYKWLSANRMLTWFAVFLQIRTKLVLTRTVNGTYICVIIYHEGASKNVPKHLRCVRECV